MSRGFRETALRMMVKVPRTETVLRNDIKEAVRNDVSTPPENSHRSWGRLHIALCRHFEGRSPEQSWELDLVDIIKGRR